MSVLAEAGSKSLPVGCPHLRSPLGQHIDHLMACSAQPIGHLIKVTVLEAPGLETHEKCPRSVVRASRLTARVTVTLLSHEE